VPQEVWSPAAEEIGDATRCSEQRKGKGIGVGIAGLPLSNLGLVSSCVTAHSKSFLSRGWLYSSPVGHLGQGGGISKQ